jgi:hypothetical protein
VEQILFSLDGLGWLLLMLGPLLFVQRWLHREIQLVLFLTTRRPILALGLFSMLFFPGVLLHELSHFVMALLLRVPTGRFSLLPALLPDGKLRLGYVETAETDLLREALIGVAPLATGGLVVAYLGASQLGLMPLAVLLAAGSWEAFWQGLRTLPHLPDFWLWFYLTFTISSTMLPSASDRRTWLPIGLALLILLGLALLAGAGPWLFENIAPWFNRALWSLATVFGISLALHVVLFLPFRMLRELIQQVTGLRVVSSQGS